MEKHQLDSLLVYAFDGVQSAGRDGEYTISKDLLAGLWWTLHVVRGALHDNDVAITCLQQLGSGNVDLDGMVDFINRT